MVVIGVGGIGLLCLMVARAAGAGRLIAIDPSEHTRQRALALGATHTIEPVATRARRQVYEILPDGPDVIVEAAGARAGTCSGSPPTRRSSWMGD
ncbi:MAG: zinc-binding dehydrogenase [Anaerolineae bacterium]|nr:zinc-binding dehydrogenase [Anaerolineae bacterium]